MDSVILKLTPEQAENLLEILRQTQDEGPQGEGWASPELKELRAIIENAIE